MSLKHWLLLSGLVNAVLLTVVWHQRRMPSVGPEPAETRHASAMADSEAARPGISMFVTNQVTASFAWAELESTDYRAYVANLRSIGCPERTIAHILRADLHDVFEQRINALVDSVSGKFWELVTKPGEMEAMLGAKYNELQALDDERKRMLAELLGRPDEEKRLDRHIAAMQRARELDFLPDEKVQAVVEIEAQFQKEFLANVEDHDLPEAEMRTRQEAAEERRKNRIRELLTAEEYTEYELRSSDAAGTARYQLQNLEISEAEARQLATLQKEPEADRRAAELLGEERYAMYQRTSDRFYREALEVMDRHELPEEKAIEIHDMQRAAQRVAGEIRSNADLTPAERESLLAKVREETAKSISAALGPGVFDTYESHAGDWLNELLNNGEE
ncbi:MAG TPA: hypothetical protein VEH04_00495 [Verrucomicrobiae bacterium]|nr:hypothetical protein [Verrucomicrobiae bacterium]